MNHLQGFAASAYGLGSIASRSIRSASLGEHAKTTTPDGSNFYTDSDGDVIYAQYASGAIVSRKEKHVTVCTADGDYWMGNLKGDWFRLD